MEKRFYMIFFSKQKECEWLNDMGKKGFCLTKINDSCYHFTLYSKQVFHYSIEHLDFPVGSEKCNEYFEELSNNKITHLFTKGKWSYFYTISAAIVQNKNTLKNNRSVYGWRTFYLFVFSLISSIFCGYHVFASKYILNAGHTGTGRLQPFKINDETYFNSLKELLNKFAEFLNNGYLSVFRNIFGENDSAVVLAFLIPITIVLIVYFALNLNECVRYKYLIARAPNKQLEGIKNAK